MIVRGKEQIKEDQGRVHFEDNPEGKVTEKKTSRIRGLKGEELGVCRKERQSDIVNA